MKKLTRCFNILLCMILCLSTIACNSNADYKDLKKQKYGEWISDGKKHYNESYDAFEYSAFIGETVENQYSASISAGIEDVITLQIA